MMQCDVLVRICFLAGVILTLMIGAINVYKEPVAGNIPTIASDFKMASIVQHSPRGRDVKAITETRKPDRNSDQNETPQRRLPQCIIVGVNKGGTRALLAYLGLHPDIVTTHQEINYFSLYYDKGLDWYRSQMPLSTRGQLTIEKSPKYYETAEAPKRIHGMNASIKVLLTVRDPVHRSMSNWLHICRNARRKRNNTAVCRTYEDSGILTRDGNVDPNCEFIRRSSYTKFIDNWTRWFPLGSQLHVVDGGKLVTEPLTELAKVETFLGLQHQITEKNVVFNSAKGFYCPMTSVGKTVCLGKNKGVKHPTLAPGVEAKLRRYFKPLNLRFYRSVGYDFGWS